MEKIKSFFNKVKLPTTQQLSDKLSNFFYIQNSGTTKKDPNWKNIIGVLSGFLIITTFVAFLKPENDTRKFREVNDTKTLSREEEQKVAENTRTTAQEVWQNPPRMQMPSQGGQPNLNTPMLVGPGANNSHLQFNAGTKVRVKMTEKFMASDEPTPVIAVTIEDIQTEAGILLPTGSQLYGEASHIRGSSRAKIEFKQIAEPSGRIRPIQGLIVGLDGERGIKGKLHSDGLKNSAGQVLTTFVAGLAGGSVERDFMGQSKGGITNGLLNAVSETARDRATKYGESLKEAREWVEIDAGSDAEVVLTTSLKMIESESR